MSKITGKAVVYNLDDVSTDQIFPGGYVNITDPKEMAMHVLEGADKTLKDRFRAGGNILVSGDNFGCGSSREQAVISLQVAGVDAVIVKSAGRIWYRNAVNLALPVIICSDLADNTKEGDQLSIDLSSGKITNVTTGSEFQGEPLPEFVMNIFLSGGATAMMQKKLAAKK
ncbi:MAG: 3-isopropylmalate dehydratase small subunit [Negativicutes bacterium]